MSHSYRCSQPTSIGAYLYRNRKLGERMQTDSPAWYLSTTAALISSTTKTVSLRAVNSRKHLVDVLLVFRWQLRWADRNFISLNIRGVHLVVYQRANNTNSQQLAGSNIYSFHSGPWIIGSMQSSVKRAAIIRTWREAILCHCVSTYLPAIQAEVWSMVAYRIAPFWHGGPYSTTWAQTTVPCGPPTVSDARLSAPCAYCYNIELSTTSMHTVRRHESSMSVFVFLCLSLSLSLSFSSDMERMNLVVLDAAILLSHVAIES